MADTKEISEMIERRLASIELPERARGLYEPVRYALEGGGKRLRPLLAVQACRACGGSADDAVDAALGLEMFHNFTLVHDDIMDNSDTRRGRPSVAARFGNNQAILSGDAMLTLASQLMERVPEGVARAVMSEFNDMALRVYEGQQLDTEFEHRNATIDEYFEMIRLKTGALLASACRIGAMIGGADKATADALYEYGMELGIAFQLRDDWLDTFGDAATFGKPIGGDIVNEKKTWMLITARRESHGELDAILDEDLEPAEKIRQVTRLYERLRVGDRCDAAAAEHHALAIAALDKAQLAEPQLREFFIETVDRMASRKL
ncbi:MAG: polyprenyl synthetase family protein [Muribaculaceae bacterium]|nr:polyprenyl synthetase family protein [Muribaculaceae bacterium]